LPACPALASVSGPRLHRPIGDGRMSESALPARTQFRLYFALAALMLALAGVGNLIQPLLFQRFFGQLSPILVLLLTTILGFAGLYVLRSQGWFPVSAPKRESAIAGLYLLAPLYAAVAIAIDIVARFPRDINVLFPGSLFYYPSIGFVAEVFFHILPAALVLSALPFLFRKARRETLLWSSIAVVALVEPIFQSALSGSASPLPAWAVILSGLNIFAISVTQLVIFRSAGFIHMYAFRLAYYVLWHLAWGQLRLAALF
jgi:hypothetical protein